jgi:hypothetical protein
MKKPGQVALVPFSRVDLTPGKPRPVLLLVVLAGAGRPDVSVERTCGERGRSGCGRHARRSDG